MRVGIIGCGNMGGAIAAGIREAGLIDADNLWVTSRTEDSARRLAEEVGAQVAPDAATLSDHVGAGGVVILAVKPHLVREVAASLGLTPTGLTVVSVAAGLALADVAGAVNGKAQVARAMPNVAARVRQSMTGLAFGEDTTEQAREAVIALFEAIGSVVVLEDNQFGAFAALGGCSPAWLAATADAYAAAGVALGLTKNQALAAITQAMAGTAALLAASDAPAPAGALVDSVCSPGGTTVAGLLALEDHGMRYAAHAAVAAAAARDRELR